MQVDVMPPPASTPKEATVIVFGVYHAGHMDPEAWQWIEPKLSMSFNRTQCTPYYTEQLLKTNADAFSAIAEIARNEGLGSTVLEAHAKELAKSDLYAVVDVSGHIPNKRATSTKNFQAAQQQQQQGGLNFGMGGGGRRGRRGPAAPGAPSANPDADAALDLSVSVYARPQMTRAARVHIRYTGENEDEAWNMLNTKVRELFPEWHCVSP